MAAQADGVRQRSRIRWTPVFILSLGAFAVGTDSFVIAGILPSLARDLKISVATAGQMVTLFAVAYAVCAPILIALLNVSSPRRLLIWAMVAFGLVNIVAAIADNAVTMALARILAACLAGVYMPTAAAMASTMVPPEKRGRALAIVLGGASVATATGVPLGVWIERYYSWRMTFVFVALLAALAIVGLASILPQGQSQPKAPLRSRLTPLGRPGVPVILVSTVVSLSAGFTVYTYLAPFFGGKPAVGAGALGLLIMCFGLGSLVGSWAGGALVDRYGARRVLLTAQALAGVNFAFVPVTSRALWTACLFMLIWAVVGWGFVPAQQHDLISFAPDLAPVVLSLNASATYMGIALGSVIGGVVTDRLGAENLWVFAAALSFAALLLIPLRARSGRRAPV
jgi:predicted MFS family arabinose efflux permease